MRVSIDFDHIKPHDGSKDRGFEELVRLLAMREQASELRHAEAVPTGNPDAGLDFYWVLPNGSIWGYQAKYGFSFDDNLSRHIRDSFLAAIGSYPQLKVFHVALPFNLPSGNKGESARKKWASLKSKLQSSAAANGMNVSIVLWSASDLNNRLLMPENSGLLSYFFEIAAFTAEWFRTKVKEAEAEAGHRYTPQASIRLEINNSLDGLGLTPRFWKMLKNEVSNCQYSIREFSRAQVPSNVAEQWFQVATDASTALSDLVGISRAKDFPVNWRIIADVWQALAASLTLDFGQAYQEASKLQQDSDIIRAKKELDDAERSMWSLRRACHSLASFLASDVCQAAANRMLVVTGKPGKGKTHLLVDVALERAAAGAPTVLILGHLLAAGKLLPQIVTQLGRPADYDIFLDAIDVAAAASRKRGIVMIDALNEIDGYRGPSELGSFVDSVLRRPNLSLVLTVRSTYREHVRLEEVRHEVTEVEHVGFEGIEDEAMERYFTVYGIDLPETPVLRPEFGNPLLLWSLCMGLNKAGLRTLPRGLTGLQSIFGFLCESNDNDLKRRQKLSFPDGSLPTWQYLVDLAGRMHEANWELSWQACRQCETELFARLGLKGELLDPCIRAGLLLQERTPARDGGLPIPSEANHVIRFGFQRFADIALAERVLRDMDNEGVVRAFEPGGTIAKMFGPGTPHYPGDGLYEALCIVVPDRHGREVPILFNHKQYDHWHESWAESLIWRQTDAFTEETREVWLKGWTRGHDYFLSAAIASTGIPAHPFNADFLNRSLQEWTVAGRDTNWTIWQSNNAKYGGQVLRMLKWALNGQDKSHLGTESAFLYCSTLAWICTSPTWQLRDAASKAMVELFKSHSAIILDVLARFWPVNDDYVRERVLGAVYGALTAGADMDLVSIVANWVEANVFGSSVPANVLIRDYARGILELQAHLAGKEGPSRADVVPPFRSRLAKKTVDPWSFVPTEITELNDRDYRLHAWRVLVGRCGKHDFYHEYSGGPSLEVFNFTATPLTRPMPLSGRKRSEQLRSELGDQVEDYETLSRILSVYNLVISLDKAGGIVTSRGKRVKGQAAARRLLEGWLRRLSKRTVKQVIRDLEVLHDRSEVEMIDSIWACRWVINRAVRYGWTADRFAEYDEQSEGGSRTGKEGRPEPFSAKYLWLAWYELNALLSDRYFAAGEYGDEAYRFQDASRGSFRKIDCSWTLPTPKHWFDAETQEGWWFHVPFSATDGARDDREWLEDSNNFPSVAPSLVSDGATGKWVPLGGSSRWEAIADDSNDNDSEGFRRTVRLWLDARFVRGHSSLNELREAIELDSSRGLGVHPSIWRQVFLGEIPWSVTYRSCIADLDEPVWREVGWDQDKKLSSDIRVAQSSWQAPEWSDDCSGARASGVAIPSPAMFEALDLRWSGRGSDWLHGPDVIFQVPALFHPGPDMPLLRADRVATVESALGAKLVWVVQLEKMIRSKGEWLGRRHTKWSFCTMEGEAIVSLGESIFNLVGRFDQD